MNFSKETRDSKDESFDFDENIVGNLDFRITNSFCLNYIKVNLLENGNIEFPNESSRKSKAKLKEELLRLEDLLHEEQSLNVVNPSSKESYLLNNELNHLLEKMDTVNANLQLFVDSFKPLLLSKKSHVNSNMQELHLQKNLIEPQHIIVKSVFETTQNARKAKHAVRQLENEMQKLQF